jgi:hypothetical protein
MPENQILSVTDTIPRFDVGTKVIVRIQYTHTWSGGFVVAGVVDDGYVLGRLSDHHVLPDVFPFDDVRLERRQDPFRGIGRSHLDRRQSL